MSAFTGAVIVFFWTLAVFVVGFLVGNKHGARAKAAASALSDTIKKV